MMLRGDRRRANKPSAKPMTPAEKKAHAEKLAGQLFKRQPASKEEALQQEIGNDPEKAAALLREILAGKK